MKTKSLELKGTEIILEDNAKNPIVNIKTENADIYINEVLVWSRYENKELAYIPETMRNIIADNNCFMEVKNDVVTVDMCVNEASIEMYIPINARKLITARFDLIDSIDELEDDYIRNTKNIDGKTADALMGEIKSMWKELEDTIKSYDYKFAYSHSMNDSCGGWWDIIFKRQNWNEDNFKNICTLVTKFNKYIDDIWKEYNL